MSKYEVWHKDSGASNHYTNSKKELQNYQENFGGYVTVANSETLRIEGHGTKDSIANSPTVT
jgi:hypothetical protein